MKKTTVLIDEQLLQAAMNIIGVKTKKEAIQVGLETIVRLHQRDVRLHQRESLQKELGTFDLSLSLEELERLRNAE